MNNFVLRKSVNSNHIMNSHSLAAYSTDSRSEMKGEIKGMLFPDLLQTEISKTMMADSTAEKAVKIENRMDWMGLFSTMFNRISNKIIGRAETDPYYSVVDKETTSFWHWSRTENKNIGAQDTGFSDALDMNGECKSPVAACEDKLNSIRNLLSSKSVPISPKTNTYRSRRPRKVFVESSSVEDNFEDAYAPEDFISHPNLECISHIIPPKYQELQYYTVEAPKMRVETGFLLDNVITNTKVTQEIVKSLPEDQQNVSKTRISSESNLQPYAEPEKTDIAVHIDSVDDITTDKKETVTSCEEKMLKLKAMLQGKSKKNTKSALNLSDSNLEPVTERHIETSRPPKMVPVNNSKDKRYKNPNRQSKNRRKKCNIRRLIKEDMSVDQVFSDDVSSVENSPQVAYINVPSDMPSPCQYKDYFDEIAGRFLSNSGAESDDSFQVVFTDSPQANRSWRPSDCESEDSFIVFEEQPDSCYTSNGLFTTDESDSDSEYTDSDSDMSDSGCGLDDMKMPHSMSKSVGDLTDDNLYVDKAVTDEVDCAVIPSSDILCDVSEPEMTSKGVLLNDAKKQLRKDQPPKKVHFSEKPPKVLVMRVWAFAARQARPGHWERYAIDRERFKRRIADADMALSWVLKPQHRSRVMFQRFMPWWNKQKRIEIAERKQREEQEKIKKAEEEKRRIDEENKRKELGITEDNVSTGANLESVDGNEGINELVNRNSNDLESKVINEINTKTIINRTDNNTDIEVIKEPDLSKDIANFKLLKISNDDLKYKQIVPLNDKLDLSIDTQNLNEKLSVT